MIVEKRAIRDGIFRAPIETENINKCQIDESRAGGALPARAIEAKRFAHMWATGADFNPQYSPDMSALIKAS